MPSLGRNIAANFAGKASVAILGILFPPIIARLLGIESYGLVGVYSSLAGALAILDLGLTATLTRELARLSTGSGEETALAMRHIVRTFELVFWTVAFCVGGLVFVGAPLVGRYWVHAQRLQPAAITSSIRLMGLVLCLQWPSGMYNGGLLGLQRQVSANVVQVAGATLRSVGGVVILWKVSPTAQAFFLWQAGVAGIQTIATAIVLSRTLPRTGARGAFRWGVLLANWRFSLGASIITLLAILLPQADKVIVSKLLTLTDFGYYTLAWAIGGALNLLVSPVFVAVFPRLTQLAQKEETPQLARLYHSSSQLVSVALLPAAVVLAMFSREIVWAWTGDLATVSAIRIVAVAIAVGTTLNGLMNIPYALQLAYGWTRLAIWSNAIAVAVIIPLTYFLANRYGTIGAASGWAVLNAGYVIFTAQAMHRRLLRSEKAKWYLVDIGAPFAGAILAAAPIRAVFASPASRGGAMVLVVGAAVASVLGAGLASPAVRQQGLESVPPLLRRLRGLRAREPV